jgi:hypothetical protein
VVPFVAVKFATKCNIVVMNHVHVLNHWKDYKDQFGNFEDFVGKLGVSTYISHLV